MNVRSDDPVWIRTHPPHFSHAQPVVGDLTCEVAIVGAGVSGALVGHHLAKKGVDVVVLDRRQPGSGSTAACTALVQYDLDRPLTELAERYSMAHAIEAYQTCVAALGWIAEHVRTLDDDCAMTPRPSLLVARRRGDLKPMRAELDARAQAGIAVRWVEPAELKSSYRVAAHGAIESEKSLELDPYRLTVATLNAATKLGARIHAPAEVVRYDFDDTGVSLALDHGPVVRAKRVVVCGGYETPSFLRQDYGTLLSTWAVASSPIDLDAFWPKRQLLWEWGDAYLYARSTPDNRLIFGGGDRNFKNATLRDALIPRTTDALIRKLKRLLPGIELVPEFKWAGTFAETEDSVAYIGVHPDFPRASLALGYGGNGVTFSMIAARILTGQITGDAELRRSEHLFRFER